MTDWRPIETAPRDGTKFLAWCSSSGLVLMRFNDEISSETWSLSGNAKQPEPTHWMPLPEKPHD